jgi:hypothetical protein
MHGVHPEGEKVKVSQNPPNAACQKGDFLVGEGGGYLGGGFIPNDDLVEYAMNDLRNQARERGYNYVQYDTPQMGEGKGTTTTVTISGTGYSCPS